MSTLKVTNIESPSGGGVSAKINDIGGGQLSNRNLVINGAMQVAQRGTTFAGSQVAAYRTCDRFVSNVFQLGTWTINQRTGGFGDTWEAGATERFRASFEHVCTTADASPQTTDNVRVIQYIEAQNLQHLNYGQATAKQLTLSFWVKSNKTGAASFEINQPDNSNRMFSTSYTINAADTWEKKVINIPADTSGVIDNNTDRGLMLQWWLNSGPSFTGGAHSSTWVAQSDTARNATNLGVGGAVNDNWSITGVQLEVGNLATSFEHRSYGDELARCQRYYYEVCDLNFSSEGIGSGEMWENDAAYISVSFPTTMRALPSFSGFGAGTGPGYIIVYANNTVGYSNDSNSILALQRAGVNGAMIYTNNFVDTASGVGGSIRTFTQGHAVWMEKRSSSLRINFNAEL